MPFRIIVTISSTADSEVFQAATALVYKFTRERSIWYHVVREPGGWRRTLHMAPGDPMTLAKRIADGDVRLDGGGVYVIAHGGGGAIRDRDTMDVVAMLAETLEAYLQVPRGTRFKKLAFLVCNFGKLKEPPATNAAAAPAPPKHLMEIAQRLLPYSFERVIAWNGWVTIFTFKLLAQMVEKYQREILVEVTRLLETFEASKSFGAKDIGADLFKAYGHGELPIHDSMVKVLKAQMATVSLGNLLRLVGKRMTETRLAATGPPGTLGPKRKILSNWSDVPEPMTKHMPTPLEGFGPRMHLTDEDAAKRKMLLQFLYRGIVRVILEYENATVWVYYPGTTKLVMCDPQLALALGLDIVEGSR